MIFLLGWLEKRLKVPDVEPKQQPYFRYPMPDPYHGFFETKDRTGVDGGTDPEEEIPEPDSDQ